jgi:hypothetical protein
MNRLGSFSALLGAVLLSTTIGLASPITFSGGDATGPGAPNPNSSAALNAFLLAAGALGNVQLIDFESQSLGSPAVATNLGSGVTYTPTNPDSFSGIFGDNDGTRGFNTTSAGSQHLRYSSSSTTNQAVFSFASPIVAFGVYVTGVNVGSPIPVIRFNDGTVQTFELTQFGSGVANVQFFGFTNAGNPISSVEFVGNVDDIFGIDDVRFVSANGVPEPGTWGLVLGAGLMLGAWRRLRG